MKQKMISRISALILAGSMAFTTVDLPELAKAAESGATETVKTTDEIIGNDEAGIPDENFYASVIEVCDINQDGMLQTEEAKECTELKAEWSSIKNLKGIEYFINLETLFLRGNQISDISHLSKMVNLESLDLGYNQIEDISVLTNITKLKFLALDVNHITNLNVLSNMTELKELYIHDNLVNELSALSNMRNLEKLYAFNNKINDLSALSELRNLIELDLSGNQVDDISPLGEMKNLTKLYLENNQIGEINVLGGLENLTYLDLSSNNVSEINVLGGLENLAYLNLTSNNVSNISCLKDSKLVKNAENIYFRFFLAEGNSITREDEVLVFPEAYCNSQFYREGFDPTYVAYPDDTFKVLLEQNQENDVIVKSDSDTLLTFAKGTMKAVSGKESYDFFNAIEKDFSKLDKLPADITRENFVLQITYGESGAFPAEAEVYLFAGKEYAGERLSYGRLENGRLADVNSAVVNEKGYIKVKQDKGGTYLLSVSDQEAEIIEELESANTGETVEAEFSEEDAVLSQNVLEAMQDKDVNLKVTLDNGIAWNVNGKSLPETGLSNMDLAVKKAAVDEEKIEEKEISDLAGTRSAGQLVFHENGELGFAAQLMFAADAQAKGDKAVLLQKAISSAGTSGTGTSESAGEQLQLTDACMIKDQSVTFEISRKADSAVIYGTNGDTDGDGAVKLTDMMQVLHHVSSRKTLNEVQKGFADVDMNNKVEIQDLMRELHFVSKRSQSVYEVK